MPSEVAQKENEVVVECKKIVENQVINNKSIKENLENCIVTNSITEGHVVAEDISSNENSSKETIQGQNNADSTVETENENKENEEPVTEDLESKKKRAEELLAAGKRSLAIKDYQAASDVLSEACSLFGTVYGEIAEECAEAYFKYGCALLELSKDQTSPVGLEEKEEDDADEEEEEANSSDLKGVNSDETNNEKINDQEEISITNGKAEIKKNNSDVEMNNANDETNNVTTNGEDNQKLVKERSSMTNVIETSITEDEEVEEKEGKLEEMAVDIEEKQEEEDIADDEDVNDLQVAWEMLDLAKVIYKKMDTEEAKLKLAEVLMKCGDVSIEDEKFETAIEDMTEALNIRRLLLPGDSRIIAETLFQLGIAQELGGSGERAVELMKEAATVLDQRIKNLESSNSDEKSKEEIAEIKTVIPEIQERIIDINERKKAAISALLAAVGAANEGTKNGCESSSSKEVSNINHLIRKRPKQSDSDETPNKIPKIEEPDDKTH
ncbi:protein HGV2 [Daktulosphaira vitifoliae]|uniref:protein HGV2 n=1 Tax=Daktulosphaira vitifoliae TaxID=58002 RepID=UPI0021AB0543|nr:protein HGV2 [Daktulosphaira vitifoliae]